MKLQKLMFYAYAWYLAHTNRSLFQEDYEAWPWGPVLPNIYAQTRPYGRGPVTGKLHELARNDGTFTFRMNVPEGVASDLKPFMKSIWDAHKAYTAIQLSNSTHAPGEPWTIVRDGYGSLDEKPVIPNDLIATVFKQKLERARPNTTPNSSTT